MKKLCSLTAFVFFSIISLSQEIPAAPDNKAVVYFVRVSQLGFAINFTYFDSTQFIMKFNGQGYFRYECEPGRHIFWARSENRSFVEANLEAGKIYFIEALPSMGALKATVELRPIDPANAENRMRKILKLMGKYNPRRMTAENFEEESNQMDDVARRGWEKYQLEKSSNTVFPQLTATMNYQPKPTVSAL